ncbi:MAG TPA: Twin-arginine translocation pathway signal sequence domain protein, partial [Pirellulales bacterium]
HGAAAPLFLLGDKVQRGVQGGRPDLSDLDDGDLRHKIDFRDVYASILRDWLKVDPTKVLGERESTLKLFA